MKQSSIGTPKQGATVATFTGLMTESKEWDCLGACDANNLLMGWGTTFSTETGIWQRGVQVFWTAFYPLQIKHSESQWLN